MAAIELSAGVIEYQDVGHEIPDRLTLIPWDQPAHPACEIRDFIAATPLPSNGPTGPWAGT